MKAIIISKVFDKFDTILELDSNSKYFESSIEKKCKKNSKRNNYSS